MSKFINFIQVPSSGKTEVYTVETKACLPIGTIKWYGSFRKYCFFPNANTVWDTSCLNDVIYFMSKLQREYEAGKKDKQTNWTQAPIRYKAF